MASSTRTYVLGPLDEPVLREAFSADGWTMGSLPYGYWQARRDGVVISFYRSGKLVVQGRDITAPCALIEARGATANAPKKKTKPTATSATGDAPDAAPATPAATPANAGKGSPTAAPPATRSTAAPATTAPRGPGARFLATRARLPTPLPDAWIGIDETGKGDYFGPLVVAAARVHVSELDWLADLGVGDSKGLTDARARALARELAPAIPHHVLAISPGRYNELYAEMKNLNKMLAWAHAAAADRLLEATEAELILSDQFARSDLVARQMKLQQRARSVRFTQRTRAEDDAAVACASIFARARFLDELRRLEAQFGVRLAKGAGSPVLQAGRALVREHGAARLRDVAKLHFKTTQQVS